MDAEVVEVDVELVIDIIEVRIRYRRCPATLCASLDWC